MEMGESIAGPGGAGGGTGKNDGSTPALVNARWEHTDDRKKRERAAWARIGDEVWLLADAQRGFSDGDTVVFLIYDDDRRFAAASAKIEGGKARVKWVVRTKEPGNQTSKGRPGRYPRDAKQESERVRSVRLGFEASGKGVMTDRARIPLRHPTMDFAIPIVFPDYRIATPVGRLPFLGHAGLLFVNGHDGRTRYYEYGRYDAASLGLVRKRPTPNVTVTAGGRPTRSSLAAALAAVSARAGHGGRIEGAYVEGEGICTQILAYVMRREALNKDPGREPYHLTKNNCMTFARDAVAEAGMDTPWAIDPRPVSYMDALQGYYPAVRWDPQTRQVTVEDIFESAAAQTATPGGP